MITLKGSRKAQRRQAQVGSQLQLQKIEAHLAGYAGKGESPAQAVKRLVEEVQSVREKTRQDAGKGEN